MIIYSVVWPKSFHFVSYQNQNDKNSDFFFFFFFFPFWHFVEIVNENGFKPDRYESTI